MSTGSANLSISPDNKKFNYGWVVIGVFMAIDSLIMGVTFSLGLMLPLISDELGMGLGQSGWLGAMNWEISAIFTIPVAYRLSRYDPKLLITLSYVGAAAFLFAQGLAPNYWVLLITRMAYISVGLARFAAKPNLIQQWFPREKIPMVNSLLTTGMGVAAGVVVFFMGGIIGGLDGWRNTF